MLRARPQAAIATRRPFLYSSVSLIVHKLGVAQCGLRCLQCRLVCLDQHRQTDLRACRRGRLLLRHCLRLRVLCAQHRVVDPGEYLPRADVVRPR